MKMKKRKKKKKKKKRKVYPAMPQEGRRKGGLVSR